MKNIVIHEKLDNDKTREAREKIDKEINLCFKNI